MVINPRIGRWLNQTIIGYRTVEQTSWNRLPIGLRIYSKGLFSLSDRHLTISTHRDGCRRARAAQHSWTELGPRSLTIYDATLSRLARYPSSVYNHRRPRTRNPLTTAPPDNREYAFIHPLLFSPRPINTLYELTRALNLRFSTEIKISSFSYLEYFAITQRRIRLNDSKVKIVLEALIFSLPLPFEFKRRSVKMESVRIFSWPAGHTHVKSIVIRIKAPWH